MADLFSHLPNSTRKLSLTIHTIGKMIAFAESSVHVPIFMVCKWMQALLTKSISNKNEYKEKINFIFYQSGVCLRLFLKKMEMRGRRKRLLLMTRYVLPVFISTNLN
jgi:hypothetical protein